MAHHSREKEENILMDKERQRTAKQHIAMLMEQGTSWKEATAMVSVPISRSIAYRWLTAWRTQREAALQDGRHGHPAKLRGAVWTLFEEMVKAAPETPSREIQATLQRQFGSRSVSGISIMCAHIWV